MQFASFDQVLSTPESNWILLGASKILAERITCTTTREYFLACIGNSDFSGLRDHSPAYAALSVSDASAARQISAFFSKRKDVDAGIDRRAAAIATFADAESLCRETNELLRLVRKGEVALPPPTEVALYYARQWIAKVLGPVPSISDLSLRFGPGATTSVSKKNASPVSKLDGVLSCSEDLIPIVRSVLEELPAWVASKETWSSEQRETDAWGIRASLGQLFELPLSVDDNSFIESELDKVYACPPGVLRSPDPGSYVTAVVPVEIHTGRLAFVPKSYKTDRSVMVEPVLNTMLQGGLGRHISGRLRKFGLDIRQQEPNQALAQEGSLTGALATLDLSSASDTIATELVWDLLPHDWAWLLSKARTSRCDLDGESLLLEKFCSMGNGFTFPLETLIFWALTRGTCEALDISTTQVRVYGDDIIVPCSAFEALCANLRCLGFLPNKTKSFAAGPFRESCGADYLRGFNIRPSFVTDALAGFDIFRLHNQFVRKGDEELAAHFRHWVSPAFALWGPDGYGDGHLIGDYARVPFKRNRGWSGHTFETYTFKAKKQFFVLAGDHVFPSYTSYADSSSLSHERLHRRVRCDSGYSDFTVRGNLPDASHVGFSVYDELGRLGVSTPGRESYNRIRIYVLA